MRTYIIRRVLLMVPTLVVVSLIVFGIVRLVPGDIIDMMVQGREGSVVAIDRAVMEHALGLDVPFFTQYGRWLGVLPGPDSGFNGIIQGNLGNSLWGDTPVLDDIIPRLPITIQLGLMAMIISQLIALPIGIYSALRQDTWGDYVARSFAILCIAVPGFWLGTMVIVFPAIWWGYSPPVYYVPFTEDPIANLHILIIPSLILGMLLSGATMRMTRSMMLEVLRQDYIRTAWAKGLRERVVVVRHTLKNALIPVITIIGLQLPIVIGGTVIIEQIFSLPGMGRLIVDSTLNRDYPVISGAMFVFGAALVLINLVVDLAYAYLDPRIRYK